MKNSFKNLIIFASPKKDSFTARLLKEHCLYKEDETYFYDCFKKAPLPCNACNYCTENDTCRMEDLKSFFEIFEKAENVTFAFPIYNGGFPAPLKALIDRFQPYYNARFFKNKIPPIKGHREVTLIITKGSSLDCSGLILEQIRPLFTVTGCSLKKLILQKDTDKLNVNDNFSPEITLF